MASGKNPSDKSRFVTALVPLAMITVITLCAFANAWPNSLVLDDKAFVGLARPPELDSLQFIFSNDVWAAWGRQGGFYRPLFLLSLSVESSWFGNWSAGYHLSNILQHLLVTFLLYGFLRQLLRMSGNLTSSADLYALLTALIFAVHPVHTEVVDSIFNRSGLMVALFGLAGLWWLLHHLDSHRGKAWLGLGIAYSLALFCKESAVVIPGLAVAMVMLLPTGSLVTRIRKCLPVFWLLLPLAVYLAMRAHALAQGVEPGPAGLPAPGGGMPPGHGVPGSLESLAFPGLTTLIRAASVFGEAMKVIVWPYPLHLYYGPPSKIASLWYLAMNLSLITAFLVLLYRKRFSLAAGLSFFYIAMLPASRIFDAGHTNPHIAERYLYFPSVGLAIILAFAFAAIAQRIGPRVLAALTMSVVLVLAALTWDRNADWSSEVSLFEREYQLGDHGINTLRILTAAQLNAKNQARVVTICDENESGQERFGDDTFVRYCAIAYEHQRRMEAAERAYLIRTRHGDDAARTGATLALAHFYVRQNRLQDAERYFKAAIDGVDDPAVRALYTAEMILSLNPQSRAQGMVAKNYISRALSLRPGWPQAEQMLEVLEHALQSSSARQNGAEETPEN